MNSNENSINWFEIPVEDMLRAKHFYQIIFSIHMEQANIMDSQMAFFPSEKGNGKMSGALVKSEMHKSNTEGVLIYLNANPDISAVLARIEEEGGVVLQNKTSINAGSGFIAIFLDTEGNRVALHSNH